VVSTGHPHPVPAAVRDLLPTAPAEWIEHDELLVAAPDGTPVEADWRWTGTTPHAATLEGLAAALAWSTGHWHRRFELAALLEDPTRTAELARDRWFD
jgi:hypothetical protein